MKYLPLPHVKCYKFTCRIIFFMVLIAVTACSVLIEPDKSIITDIPCAAPCWQGIKPGATMTADEVIHVLDALSTVETPWRPTSSTIAWYWNQPPWKRTMYNSVYLENGLVETIRLSIDFDLTVKQIVDKYGIPDAATASEAGLPEHRYINLNLFYPTRGLTFSAEILPLDLPVLQPDTKIKEALYTVPAESLADWQAANTDIALSPWPDYGAIDVP